MTQQISKIYVTNSAGFNLNFTAIWLDGDGHWHAVDWHSGSYPIDQKKETPDLGTLGVPNNSVVNVRVHADGGKTKDGNNTVVYVSGSTEVATYNVHGATLTFHVDLND